MGAAAEEEIERLLAVFRDVDVVREVVPAQGAHRQLHVRGVVVDQQDLDFAGGYLRHRLFSSIR
jgi:hypothetical protein